MNEESRKKCHRNKIIGAFLLTTGTGMALDVVFSNFFAIFESKTSVLVKTLITSILLIWISLGLWLLIWACTLPRVWARPHVEGTKEFLAYVSKEIEGRIKKYTISKEDEKKLKQIVESLNQYLTKKVRG